MLALSISEYVLNSFLKDLSQTIVHNILFPATSEYMRPSLHPRVSTVEFWHAQLNYAVLRAEAAFVSEGSAEGIAGDQLCQWNTIASDAIIPSTHLTPLSSSLLGCLRHAGRFQRPSERAPFSNEGGFTFSEGPFEDTLHEGLKGSSPLEGFKRA